MMIKILKNIAAILLLAVFMLTSIGYSISLHYCNQSGDISASFFGKAKCEHKHQIQHSCCESSTEESCSCENHQETGNPEHSVEYSCCVSKTEFFALNEQYLSPEPLKAIHNPENVEYIISFVPFENEYKISNEVKLQEVLSPDSPPKRLISYICSINSNRSEIPSAS